MTAIIENEARYQAAIERRIKANRAKSGRAKWLAAHADAQKLHDWLFGQGEFEDTLTLDPLCYMDDGYVEHRFELNGEDYRCKCKRAKHPLSYYARGDFMDKMRSVIDEWGGLTDGQHAVVAKAFADAEEKLANRDIVRAAQVEADVATNHVGTVGERRDFVLSVKKVLEFDSQFGAVYINICRDGDNNTVIYKGGRGWREGETVTVKATVKAHEFRDGVPQTLIQRPKVAE